MKTPDLLAQLSSSSFWPEGVELVVDERPNLDSQLALAVAQQLEDALEVRDRASLAVSGGRTPVEFFQALSRIVLPWGRVDITLADERWVPADHEASNERLVRENLLQGPAAAATFHPLKRGTEVSAEYHCDFLRETLPWPLDVLILGMGNDGHTASLFPDAPELVRALDPANEQLCQLLQPPSQPQMRVSLTRRTLSEARWKALHLRGEQKLKVLKRALDEPGDRQSMPVRAFLQRGLSLYWSPE